MKLEIPPTLKISCILASAEIKEGIVAPSNVLANLFRLQKDIYFPKKLEKEFFRQPAPILNEAEKKACMILLEEFKKPQANISDILQQFFLEAWGQKKINPVNQKKKLSQNKILYKNSTNKKNNKQIDKLPTVIIKKSKTRT